MPAPDASAPHPLTLQTLGRGALLSLSPDTPAPLLGPGKPLALLVYLTCAPRHSATRDHLVDLLWADLDPDKGRHALRQTVWYIKRQVGESLLVTSDGRVELSHPLTSDRDLLLAASERGDLDAVVRTYQGEFLPSFAVPGGAEFERWADIERLRLRAHFLQAAEELTRQHLASARFREGVALARRARDEAPLDERPWRLLLEALAACGDQLRFNAESETLRRMLATEEREGEPATMARMQWPGDPAPPSPDGGETRGGLTAELTGRQEEFNRILRAWEAVRAGASRRIHLSAPAGLGKTRLLLEAQRRIRAGGGRTLYLRSTPGSRTLAAAYAGDLAHALAQLPGAKGVGEGTAAVLLGLDPSLAAVYRGTPDPATGDEATRRRILALTDLAAAVAEEAPVALFLDDLHWADRTSRQLLGGVAERLGSSRILLITAARPLPDLVPIPEAERIELQALTPPQLVELMSSLAPMPEAPWAAAFGDRLWDASRGSPLLALEALQLSLDEGVLRLDREGWHCDAPGQLSAAFPEGGALRRRVEALPRIEGWLLLLLACEGGPIAADDLAKLGGHPRDQADAALAALEQRGILHRTGELMEPAHDEFARLALEVAEPGARTAAHRALARRGDPSDLRRRAFHLRAADDRSGLDQLFLRWVRERRAAGDRRPTGLLAADLLGAEAGGGEVARLVQSAPWRLRAWGSTRARVATAAALLLGAIALGATALPRHRGAGGPELTAITLRDDGGAVGIVPIGGSPASAQHDLVALVPAADTQWISLPRGVALSGTPSQNASGWTALQLEYPDGGGVDIGVVAPDGAFHRLTHGREDDNITEWSPDGRLLIGTSGAQGPGRADYDITAVDPRSGRIRRLTTGSSHDQGGRVSPDGTRLAFVRMSLDTLGPRRFCVSWFDGSEPRCREVPGGDAKETIGWIDRERVLVGISSTGGSALAILGARDLALTRLRPTAAPVGRLSPDRRWVLCHCRPDDGSGWQLMEVADPDHLIEIRGAGGAYPQVMIWGTRTGSDTTWVEELRLRGPAELDRGETGRFEAEALSARGEGIGGVTIRWGSRDTTLVQIDPRTGVARGVGARAGATWIVASAGGWRVDSAKVAVAMGHGGVAVERDRWEPGWEGRWQRGGDPWPRLVVTKEGRALDLNGDGSYSSGVGRWPGWRGPSFGVEFSMRLRVTRVNWQVYSVGIDAGTDSLALARWDHRTGTRPTSGDGVCAATYGGESRFSLTHLGVQAGQEGGTPAVDPALGSGVGWHRIRVQIFPDGGCGVAVDGHPLWMSSSRVVRRGPPLISAYGMSYQTEALVQGIESWEGVRGGVDWTRAPTSAELRARDRASGP